MILRIETRILDKYRKTHESRLRPHVRLIDPNDEEVKRVSKQLADDWDRKILKEICKHEVSRSSDRDEAEGQLATRRRWNWSVRFRRRAGLVFGGES